MKTRVSTSDWVLADQGDPLELGASSLMGLSCAAVVALSLVSVAAVAAERSAAPVRPPQKYDVHSLTLNGADCRVNGIDAGTAVGACFTPDGADQRAFVWTEETGVVDIGTLGGSSAGAGVIDRGRVAGSSDISGDLEMHAFKWSADTGMLDIGTLGGVWAGASGISGDAVVGESATTAGEGHAFLWTAATGMIDLPRLRGGVESSAAAIDNDLVAGWSTTDVPGRRPVAWRTNGEIIDLIDEPIESGGFFVRGDGQATAVKNGLVVGYRRIASPLEESRAFGWREEQGLIDLGLVPGSNESFAFDTDGEFVVGQLSGVGGPTGTTARAFVWTEERGMRAITPSSITAWATHVVDGQVLGIYHTPETNGTRVFLWTKQKGLVDVVPRGFPGGFAPVGIDADGRIAIVFEDEDPASTRSVVLVPRR